MTPSSFSRAPVNTSLSGVAPSSAPCVLLSPMPIQAQPSALRQARRTRTRPRAKTSSERGQLFRQRQKQYVDALEESIRQLREQISQLSASTTNLTRERALLVRTNDWGSLVQISRELYTVFRYGLKVFDPGQHHQHQQDPEAVELQRASAQYKQHFLRQVVDPDVMYGSLVGVDELITQWLRHTASYSQLEIELGRAECIADADANPVVMIHTKVHARLSRESFPVMFPFVAGREDLIQAFIDRDLTFDCVTWFEFSETERIITYNVQVNYVEAFVMAVGSARLVAELMENSVVTPDSVLLSPVQSDERRFEYASGYAPVVSRGHDHHARSLSIHDLLSDSSESGTKDDDGGYFADHRRYSDEFAPLSRGIARAALYGDYGYEDDKVGDGRISEVVQL